MVFTPVFFEVMYTVHTYMYIDMLLIVKKQVLCVYLLLNTKFEFRLRFVCISASLGVIVHVPPATNIVHSMGVSLPMQFFKIFQYSDPGACGSTLDCMS